LRCAQPVPAYRKSGEFLAQRFEAIIAITGDELVRRSSSSSRRRSVSWR
jgi:hypothetical protein